MGFRNRLRTPGAWLAVFVLLGAVPLVALSWLAWRLLEQDRALEAQRVRERLDNAAALASRELGRSLDAWNNLLLPSLEGDSVVIPRDAVLVVFDSAGVLRAEGTRLPYYPKVSSPAGPPAALLASAEANFGDTCRVRVVDHRGRPANVPGKKLAGVGANPGAIHVGSRVSNAVLDDGGKGDAGVSPVVEVRGDMFDDVRHRVWQRWLRRINAKAFRDELTGFHVNRSTFDSGSANVDSKKCQSDFLLTAPYKSELRRFGEK